MKDFLLCSCSIVGRLVSMVNLFEPTVSSTGTILLLHDWFLSIVMN